MEMVMVMPGVSMPCPVYPVYPGIWRKWLNRCSIIIRSKSSQHDVKGSSLFNVFNFHAQQKCINIINNIQGAWFWTEEIVCSKGKDICERGWNYEIWSKLWNCVEIVKYGWNYEILSGGRTKIFVKEEEMTWWRLLLYESQWILVRALIWFRHRSTPAKW